MRRDLVWENTGLVGTLEFAVVSGESTWVGGVGLAVGGGN